MKYLRKFNDVSEYNNAKTSVYPLVSICENEYKLHTEDKGISINFDKQTLFAKSYTEGTDLHVVVYCAGNTGTITLEIDGNEYEKTLVNGECEFILSNDDHVPGEYDVYIRYSGNNSYESDGLGYYVEVPKYISVMALDGNTYNDVGDDIVIVAIVPTEATGNITFIFNNNTTIESVLNGEARFQISGDPYIPSGTYTITAEYSGDDCFLPCNWTIDIQINKVSLQSSLGISTSIIDEETIYVTFIGPTDANGPITFQIGETLYTSQTQIGGDDIPFYLTEGHTSGAFPATKGTQIIFNYLGDDKYEPSSYQTTFKVDPSISCSANDISYGEKAVITISIDDEATGTITIDINNEASDTKNVNGGKVFFEINNLSVGDKTITINYSGDSNYNSLTDYDAFTVS